MSSFADSVVGVGMMSGVTVALDVGMRWVDGVRLPSTPNLNVDPEMLVVMGRAGRWGGGGGGAIGQREREAERERERERERETEKETEGEGELDRMSMVSGHSRYYSARSSIIGESVRSECESSFEDES
jgi:hypothetical protein